MASMQGELPLDLSRGFDWHAVLTLSTPPPKPAEQPGNTDAIYDATGKSVIMRANPRDGDRKVIYEAGRPNGPKVTIALDPQDRLFLAATDVEGVEHRTTPIEVPELARPTHVAV